MRLVRIAVASVSTVMLMTACERAPPSPAVGPPADAPAAELIVPVSLENTHWHLAQLAGLPSAFTPADRTEPYFVLMSDGRRLQGFAGCNRMAGSYETDGQSLRFGSIMSTKMACADPHNPEEGFLKALDATVRASVAGNELELFDASGTAVATFAARVNPE